jgi:alpha-glucosidase
VAGFRIDVAHAVVHDREVRDNSPATEDDDEGLRRFGQRFDRSMNQPEVHDVYRRWRKVLDSYDGDRMAVAEAWTQTTESMVRFVRPDELHQTFNFGWLLTAWSAQAFADVIHSTVTALQPVGSAPTWVLSNHDVVRHPTRYGGGARGLARARAATLTMLALPGSAYLYQGEELGLEEVDVAPEDWQDPASLRTGEKGRDGCRVPLPWEGTQPPYGFGPGAGQPWIPQPEDWADLSVEAQWGREGSTLEFYREALRARREHTLGLGDEVVLVEGQRDLLTFRRDRLTVVLNCGSSPVPLPEGEVVAASGPVGDGVLPADTAAWLV